MQTYSSTAWISYLSLIGVLYSRRILTGCLLLGLSQFGYSAPRVVASIQPVQVLAQAVMQDLGEVELLVSGFASPHTYQLRPSHARSLQKADLVVWVGEPLESFLYKPLASLDRNSRIVRLLDTPGLRILPARTGGNWLAAEHGHEHKHTDQHHPGGGIAAVNIDPHIWLDTENALLSASFIAETLIALDPANAHRYRNNLDQWSLAVRQQDALWSAHLDPVKQQPFVVFHDAYQYLEKRYGLTAVGSVAINPERRPSAKRILELKTQITALGVRCLFREPQFDPALLDTLVENTQLKIGLLDPLGNSLTTDQLTWQDIMWFNVRSLQQCLSY